MGILSTLGTLAGGLLGGPAGAAIVSGIGGLISGSLDRKAQKEYNDSQPTLEEQRLNAAITERNRFNWLRDGALKAGFNPLSVLNSTGGNMGPQFQRNTTPLSSPMADAVRAATAAYDPIAFENTRLENQLIEKQIAEIDKRNVRLGVPVLRKTTSPVDYRDKYPGNYPVDADPTANPHSPGVLDPVEIDIATQQEGTPEEITTLDSHVVNPEGDSVRVPNVTSIDELPLYMYKKWRLNVKKTQRERVENLSKPGPLRIESFPLDFQIQP